jgi:hypothetical protein
MQGRVGGGHSCPPPLILGFGLDSLNWLNQGQEADKSVRSTRYNV